MKVLVLPGVLRCGHDGKVATIASQEWVRIAGAPILVRNDPEGRSIAMCPNISTNTKQCNTTLVVGSAQASQGTVTKGNTAGDTAVGVDIGTIPPGASVTISFRAVINDPLPASVTQVINQGIISGSNFPTVPTDDPTTPAPGDPTRLRAASTRASRWCVMAPTGPCWACCSARAPRRPAR